MSASDQQQGEDPSGPLMEISSAMVQIYKSQFGRGPTRTRTEWAGADTITVVLEGTLTPAERHLVELGEDERVRELRMVFQYASVREFCEPVERITGRKVRGFISGIDAEIDGMSLETFVLHPKGYDGPSRIDVPRGKAA
jgi:uncharacterized protein YbcI